ncbi:hypothetical protein [Actinoplanes sp. URMC 104]|uniref:hypothetical protein n=1 Tax=Actinoplanes sp. URMC 104 TaxID=3423409 RepID=UPI003F19E982
MRVALAAVVAAVLLVAGSAVAWSLRSPVTAARITAAAGGTVTTEDGVSVRFGPGALSADTEVRIVPRPSIPAPGGLTWLAEPVDITIGAAALRTSATVTLPVRDDGAGGLSTVVSQDDAGVWSAEGGTVAGGAITTTVGHLAIFSAASAAAEGPARTPGGGDTGTPEPDCGTTRSQRWNVYVENGAARTCVAAGAADRTALLRLVSDRPYGQFAELAGHPPMVVTRPGARGVADAVWRELAEADRDLTHVPGGGTLDLALPGSRGSVEFVLRGGPDVAVAEDVLRVMSDAYVAPGVTVRAVRCAVAAPDQALRCVTDVLGGARVLPAEASDAEENQARRERAAVRQEVIAAMRRLPAVAADPLPSLRVTARRSPVIPRKALNEPGGQIPAAVIRTQKQLYAAAMRDALPEVVPPAGLVWSNTGLTGPAVTTAVAALVSTPPLRWPCDQTARDGYVYGLADPNLLTYPARLMDLGLPAEDIGIVRQTAGQGRDYRLCVALDGTWTALTYDVPVGEFPAADAARLAAARDCRPGAFLPAGADCRGVARTDLDGDGRTDSLLLYLRDDRWTARAVLAAGRVSDLALPYTREETPAVVADLDLDGRPGEEVAFQSGSVVRPATLTADGLVLVGRQFPIASSLSGTAGLGCSDADRDGRRELVSGSARFDRDPATGAIVAASTVATRWTWNGTSLIRGETVQRRLTGPQAGTAAGPPYRDITCTG